MPPDPPGPFQIVHAPAAELLERLSRNADAGLALVTVAAIDEWLEKLLLTAMQTLSNNQFKRIFRGTLSDVGPKADLAYAFDLIDKKTLAMLQTLKDIRNEFAHARKLLDFTSPEVVKLSHGLPGWCEGANARELFDNAAKNCVEAIDAKTQRLTFANAFRGDE